MKDIVLDTGALIALERNDRALWAALKLAALRQAQVIVPTTVLAQVWRGRASQASLSRALAYCFLAPFDRVARDVGELCAQTKTSDIVDAHVAIVTEKNVDALYTSDPKDLRRLLKGRGSRSVTVVMC